MTFAHRLLPPALMLLLGACGQAPPSGWTGYAEGDYVYVASALGGRLDRLAVDVGQSVPAQAPLADLDDALEQAMAAEASARADSAAAQASNLASGRRADEQAVVREQLAQARSTQQRAARDLQRQQDLVRQGFVSGSALDAAQTAAAQALARVRELEAALRVTTLPARTPEREAADASARAATEVARQVDWRLGQKHLLAPVAGRVEEVYFQVGETVAPGQPVLSLLPPGAVKARFYVPEADLPRIRTGMQVSLSCDGCGAPLAARVVRVATEAEYTPPVIYSNAQRARLVFMVEARPLQPATALRPGMPLDVHAVADAPRAP